MALRITVDVFSGRPNPTVVVSGLEERELRERLSPARTGAIDRAAAARLAPGAPPLLGYRGLVVEAVDDVPARGAARSRATRSAALRVAHGAVIGATGPRPLRDPSVEAYLASPSGPLRATGLDPRLLDHVAGEIERARHAAFAAPRARSAVVAAAGAPERCACAPLWDPAWWNDGGKVQSGNNCYNYAVDYRSDTYAQPGRASGAMYASMSAADVRLAALADALLDAPPRNRCRGKGHLVALCVSPWDFHWYRKQRSGSWTHKPGPDPVTQLDEAGQPIADPRTADRGPYTQFVGFLTVLHGHVKIG